MNRLQQICAEIIRLYRKQLNLWVLGKLANLPDPDVFEYKERQERIKELCAEMKQLQAKSVGINQNLCAILPKCDQQKTRWSFFRIRLIHSMTIRRTLRTAFIQDWINEDQTVVRLLP